MNASACRGFVEMPGDDVVECERELHSEDEEHRAVVYGTAVPGGSVPVTVRWRSK